MAMIDLVNASAEDFKKFLNSFDYVFSDCDGVLWLTGPLPGSGDFIKLMKENGKKVHFVSNNSTRTSENYKALFESAGIENGLENLTIPSIAIAEYLKSINFDKHVYCVTCHQAMQVLESYGLKCKYGPDVGCNNFLYYRDYLQDDPTVGAVVFDSDFKVNLPKLYKAQTYLKRPDVLFLNGPTDRLVPFGDAGYAIGATVFTDVLIEVVKRQPIGMGKPSKDYGEFAMKRAGATDPSRVLFIGDMIDQDVKLGKNTGFKTLFILTHFNEEQMRKHDIKPDFYAPSLGSLVPKFKELEKSKI